MLPGPVICGVLFSVATVLLQVLVYWLIYPVAILICGILFVCKLFACLSVLDNMSNRNSLIGYADLKSHLHAVSAVGFYMLSLLIFNPIAVVILALMSMGGN